MTVKNIPTFRPTSAPKSNPMEKYGPGMRGFFAWMRTSNPKLFGATMTVIRSPGSLKGLGADPVSLTAAVNSPTPAAPSVFDKISAALTTAAQTYLTTQQVKAQQSILKTQLQRAQQGLPPLDIDMAQYGAVPTAQFGLTSDTRNLLIFGGLGIAAIFLLKR